MNGDRRGSVPIGERTSDNCVRVRREAVPRRTRTPSYVVGSVAVAVRPHQQPPGPEGLGTNRERPPRPKAWYGRGALRVFTRWPPPSRGRSRPSIPSGKAIERHCERGGSTDRTARPWGLDPHRPSRQPNRPSVGAGARTGPFACMPPRPCSAPHRPVPPRRPRADSSSPWPASCGTTTGNRGLFLPWAHGPST